MKVTEKSQLRVPFTQQFSPEQTPLKKLLPLLRQNAGPGNKLRKAVASAFFKDKTSPEKLAGNTLIALREYGILDDNNNLGDFGDDLLAFQGDDVAAHKVLAQRILFDFNGVALIGVLSNMKSADMIISLTTLPVELEHRGFKVSKNSSDLSNVLNWLREAKVLNNYDINDEGYQSVVGASAVTLAALKDLPVEQVAFLKAMVALNVKDWTPYKTIAQHAEELYFGEVNYNWKELPEKHLKALVDKGFIEFRKKAKQDRQTLVGRGGKTGEVRPTTKFETEIAEKHLDALYRSAGFSEISAIRSRSLQSVVIDIKQKTDSNKRGEALEILTILFCQMLGLDFMGWRETDPEVAGGGEIDAMLHSSRLVYSRWQIQCKVGPISFSTVAKEVGIQTVTLASVILIVSTDKPTDAALTFRRQKISSTNLHIIFLDGDDLAKIIKDKSALIKILKKQADDALNLKPAGVNLRKRTKQPGRKDPGSSSSPPQNGSSKGNGSPKPGMLFAPTYSTELGSMFCGDALEILPWLISRGYRAKLIHTSPPFALIRKKQYGNPDADSYLRWFDQFIPYFKQILEPGGSLIIDIGGSWIKGLPVKSTYHFKVLIRLCESGFYLAQDFYHYNPARLPTPAEWVTVRRIRVKDATNNVWWLTLDPFVEADNRRVLAPYSDSMKSLLKNGYKPALRPSGHNISDKFQVDNGGAIPPNLLQMSTREETPTDVLSFSNTDSQSHYLRRCKEEAIKPHPARFPQALPEFFLKFLTQPGDLVIDTFAGSNVTGAAAERLGRQWISIELDPSYVAGSQFRFEPEAMAEQQRPQQSEIALPFCDTSDQRFIH